VCNVEPVVQHKPNAFGDALHVPKHRIQVGDTECAREREGKSTATSHLRDLSRVIEAKPHVHEVLQNPPHVSVVKGVKEEGAERSQRWTQPRGQCVHRGDDFLTGHHSRRQVKVQIVQVEASVCERCFGRESLQRQEIRHNRVVFALIKVDHHPRDNRPRERDEKGADFPHNRRDLALVVLVLHKQFQQVCVAAHDALERPVVEGCKDFKRYFKDPCELANQRDDIGLDDELVVRRHNNGHGGV